MIKGPSISYVTNEFTNIVWSKRKAELFVPTSQLEDGVELWILFLFCMGFIHQQYKHQIRSTVETQIQKKCTRLMKKLPNSGIEEHKC